MLKNDVKLQEGHPVDENLRPLKVGGKATAIETAQHGNGAKIAGDLGVAGDLNIEGNLLNSFKTTDFLIDDSNTITLDAAGGIIYFKHDGDPFALFTSEDPTKFTLSTTANIVLDAAGDIVLDAAGGDVDILQADLNIPATKKLYLDGGGDTYIHEISTDIVQFVVGGDIMAEMIESGDNGSRFHFRSACAGFTKIAEAFSDDSIIGSGGTDDTHIDFRFSNKISLAVTGNITNLNLIFPAVSGNFLLLLTYDGDHTITNYKVYEADETAADGDADVLWAGGTKPDNTASGVDILSFFYDATDGADKCYGVASLAFATP